MTKQQEKQLIQFYIAGQTMLPGSAKPAKMKLTAKVTGKKKAPARLTIITKNVERTVLVKDIEAIFIPPKKKVREKHRWNPDNWAFPFQDDFKDKLKKFKKDGKKGVVFLNDSAQVKSVYYRFSTVGELAKEDPNECCIGFKGEYPNECC